MVRSSRFSFISIFITLSSTVLVAVLLIAIFQMPQQMAKAAAKDFELAKALLHAEALTSELVIKQISQSSFKVKFAKLEAPCNPNAITELSILTDEEAPWFMPWIVNKQDQPVKVHYFKLMDDSHWLMQADPMAVAIKYQKSITILLSIAFLNLLGGLVVAFKFRVSQCSEGLEAENSVSTCNEKNDVSVVSVQEDERARVARELHDDLGQYLTGLKAQSFLIKQNPTNSDVVETVGSQMLENCDAMQASVKRLIQDLHPVILEQRGLSEALQLYIDAWVTRYNVPVDCEWSEPLDKLSVQRKTHIYRVVQEALNNIARHAQASKVFLSIKQSDGKLELRIVDNGIGYNKCNAQGLGLISMKERALSLSGEFVISKIKSGSEVIFRIPLM